jgi:type II secretory pathway component PulL
MINLLPPDIKEGYRYARRNRVLAHWSVCFLAGIVGLAVITGFGVYHMNQKADSYTKQIADTKAALARENVASVQKQVTDISNNLKLMVQVLSKEVLFSELLARLGSVTPSNVILTNLAISQSESAIDITANAGNYAAATQLQINLADPNNQIFSKADIVSINCVSSTASQTSNAAYPCTVSIRALLADDNPFLFIRNPGSKVGAS